MYNAYFGFTEKPFTIAPNPKYLFMSERHKEALAHMLYGMQGEGGVMVLTGEVGTGKTTICRSMLTQVPENTDVAYIINPKLSSLELLASICDELHISYPAAHSIKDLTDLLNEYLLEAHALGKHTVLIIDEAQNLDTSVLEQLRLLTNLETNEKKLLQIMLLGQPELAEILRRNDLRQLAQRITARYHLTPLNKDEIVLYLNHRLSVAGCEKQSIFPASVMRLLFKHTGGVPRLINLIADRALLGAYASESKQVSKKILAQAIHEVSGEAQQQNTQHVPWGYLATLLVVVVGIGFFNTQTTPQTPTVANASTAVIATPPIEIKPLEQPLLTQDKPKIEVVSVAEVNNIQSTQPPSVQAIISTTQQSQAFKTTFAAWDISYQPERDGDACTFAKQHQLLCLRQRGDIAQMRSLNRPTVLTISDNNGQDAYVSITTLSGTTATMKDEDSQVEIPLSQLALQSHNDFTILWRTPKGYQGPVRPGHSGDLVLLLAEQCSQAQNQAWIGAPRLQYDAALKEQVKSFQRSQGLSPDGVAGPITWIHINSLIHPSTPTLKKVKAAYIESTS